MQADPTWIREDGDSNILMLRDVAESAFELFYEQQLDPEATRMAAFAARERPAFVAHWANVLADDSITKRAVVFDGQVAGNIVKFTQDAKPMVGYWLGREFWGKGIATSALSQFLEIFDERPVFANVASRNIASIRVLKKCGFSVCGNAKTVEDDAVEVIDEFILKLDV
jgi:RimJ/RimL family protein N-acetyltransferase